MPTSAAVAVATAGKAPEAVTETVKALMTTYSGRDSRAAAVKSTRRGDFDDLSPYLFTEDWPRPTVPNLVEKYASDAAASMAPLPTINCSSSITLKPGAQAFADKRTKIVANYVNYSKLAARQQDFADSFNCYGMGVYRIEPDFDDMMPRITVRDGAACYVIWNSKLQVKIAVEKSKVDWNTIKATYPDAASKVQQARFGIMSGKVTVIRYEDDKQCIAYLPDHGNIQLTAYANPIGRCSYVAIPRPSGAGDWQAGEIHGAYDDLIWCQLAMHQLQMYAMEAADKSVRAPLVVPMDAMDLSFGPDAVIKTNQGASSVGRVALDVPQSAYQAMTWLERGMQQGGGQPESRSGQVDASVITGAGVNALNAGYNISIAAAQALIKLALEQAIQICFLWDEKVWPDKRKGIRGTDAGVPYDITYMPSKDIDGDYTVDIEYGFYAGLDPNRALIFILQALGAKLISQDTARRNLPAGVNPAEEEQKIEAEDLRASLMGAVAAMSQVIPAMAEQGGDPSTVVVQIATVLKGLQQGKKLEDLVVEAFKPAPAPAAPPEAQQPSPDATGAPAAPGGAPTPGLPPGAAPGDRPALQQLFAGIGARGNAQLSGGVSQQLAAR